MAALRVALVLALTAGSANAGPAYTFQVSGETFTYSDAERSFSGVIRFPDAQQFGPGPYPVIVYTHGQGGTPGGYPNLDVMRAWGAVVVAPTLSHVAGGETAPATTGHCPENLARGLGLWTALEEQTAARADPERMALFGHSKGAYAGVGLAAALGTRVRVVAISAGGIIADSAGVQQAAPTFAEAGGLVAPTLMFHGTVDAAVPPQRSQDLADQLLLRGIPHHRQAYDTSELPPSEQHNLHQVPAINADLLSRTETWFRQAGLFDPPRLFADGFEP